MRYRVPTEAGKILVGYAETHAEYDKNEWKSEL
jgi:hypothetical protein